MTADLYTAASYWAEHGGELTAAGATLLGTVIVAWVVERALVRRGRMLTETIARGGLSPVAETRLRLLRRLIVASILVVGAGLALAQIPSAGRVAGGILASSAVVGLAVGFAARQTLANAIAGVLLAVSQPFKLGDLITIDDNTGQVEDIKLTYTYLRVDDGRRLAIPNERLAQSPIENHSVSGRGVRVPVSIWLAPGADVERAIDLLSKDGLEASVGEVTPDGVELAASLWIADPAERGRVASGLRARWLGRLREAKLL